MYSVQIRQKIPAGETMILRKKLHSAGILETISFRFYPGQQLALEVLARVNRLGGSYVNIFNYVMGGEQAVAGDDDYFKESVGMPVNRGEEIELIIKNLADVPDGADAKKYAYNFQCHAFINEVVL